MSKQVSRQKSGKQSSGKQSSGKQSSGKQSSGKQGSGKQSSGASRHVPDQPKGGVTAKSQRTRQQRPARRGRTGRGRGRGGYAGMRRSRAQRMGITAVTVGLLALMWGMVIFGTMDVGLAIALSVLLLVALPAFVVLALGRRY